MISDNVYHDTLDIVLFLRHSLGMYDKQRRKQNLKAERYLP